MHERLLKLINDTNRELAEESESLPDPKVCNFSAELGWREALKFARECLGDITAESFLKLKKERDFLESQLKNGDTIVQWFRMREQERSELQAEVNRLSRLAWATF